MATTTLMDNDGQLDSWPYCEDSRTDWQFLLFAMTVFLQLTLLQSRNCHNCQVNVETEEKCLETESQPGICKFEPHPCILQGEFENINKKVKKVQLYFVHSKCCFFFTRTGLWIESEFNFTPPQTVGNTWNKKIDRFVEKWLKTINRSSTTAKKCILAGRCEEMRCDESRRWLCMGGGRREQAAGQTFRRPGALAGKRKPAPAPKQ